VDPERERRDHELRAGRHEPRRPPLVEAALSQGDVSRAVGGAPDLRRRRTLVRALRTNNGQRQEVLVLPKKTEQLFCILQVIK
jgi:hypothetical protein